MLLVLDAAYAEYVQRNDYEAGIELVATSENVVMMPHLLEDPRAGRAAARLDVRAGVMWSTRSTASAGRSTSTRRRSPPASPPSRDTAHIEYSRAHNARWLPWLTEEIRKLGLEVTPSVANFVLIHFPDTKGKTAKDADAFLTKRGLVLRQVGAYRLAQRAAHERGRRGSQPAGGAGARRVPGKARREHAEDPVTTVWP